MGSTGDSNWPRRALSCDRHGDHRRRPPRYGYAEAWSILAEGEFRDAERADKERVLELAVSRIPKGLERESRVLTGDPAARLTEASGEFDLMVVGSRAWGPLKRTLAGQHHAKADPLLRVPGSGPAARGRRRPARCPSWPGRRTRGVLRLLTAGSARRAARGPRSLDVGSTRAARASARGDPPGPLPLRPSSREGGARPRR